MDTTHNVTIGISPKAKLAAAFPAVTAVVAVLIQWAVTGSYSEAELVTTLTALAASVMAFLGAYVGNPGEVVPVVGPASDDLISTEAQENLEAEGTSSSQPEIVIEDARQNP